MQSEQKILIVEDDSDIAELLRVSLEDISFHCEICDNGSHAVERISRQDFDLIILDIMLPGLSGLEVCKEVRVKKPAQPILMLTAKSSELDQIIGLEQGADDYMTKPFSVPALQARVRAIIRRSKSYLLSTNPTAKEESSAKVVMGDLIIDPSKRLASIQDQIVDLTALEFDLIYYFIRHPERVFSRSQLLDNVWGYDHIGYEHTVNSHINRLRNKLQIADGGDKIIQTVWGVGYRLSEKSCFIKQ
ncbi:MAG: response regulator transcription factor [Enterobacterales bacterium]|nr:response regulator transcription factor [Enterobacterales bacterium]